MRMPGIDFNMRGPLARTGLIQVLEMEEPPTMHPRHPKSTACFLFFLWETGAIVIK
jgi:hypothetical protein